MIDPPTPGFTGLELPPPLDWQAFERLCRDLWAAITGDPNTQLNGRAGQPQAGVDVFGTLRNGTTFGVQCKVRKGSGPDRVTPADVTKVAKEARKFVPAITGTLYLATTASRDVAAQTRARELTKANAAEGLFSVSVVSWDDITEYFGQHTHVYARHFGGYVHSAVFVGTRHLGMSLRTLAEDVDEIEAALAVPADLARADLVISHVLRRDLRSADPLLRARLARARGDLAFRRGSAEEAATHLLAAWAHAPLDSRMAVYRVLALRLRADPSANAAAREAIAAHPESCAAWAALVSTATTTAEAEAILLEVPAALRRSPEVAVEIALHDGLVAGDPELLSAALSIAPADPRAWHARGGRLLKQAAGHSGTSDGRVMFTEAGRAFAHGAELATESGWPKLAADMRALAVSAFVRASEIEQAVAQSTAAARSFPEHPASMLARAESLLAQKAFAPAVAELRTVLASPGLSGDYAMGARWRLADALLGLGDRASRAEAAELFQKLAPEPGGPGLLAAFSAVDVLGEDGQHVEARAFVDAHPSLSAVERTAFRAVVAARAGDNDAAREEVAAAFPMLRDAAVHRLVRVRLAAVATQLGPHEPILPLVRDLASDIHDVEAARMLVHTTGKLGIDLETLAICRSRMDAGIIDPFLIETELMLVQQFDPDRTLTLLEHRIALDPDDHVALVMLLRLADQRGRRDVVERLLGSLPRVEEVDAYAGRGLVMLLRQLGRLGEALAFAYDLRRRFPDDEHANNAYKLATTHAPRLPARPIPTVVAPGCSVELEEADGKTFWRTLEDSPLKGVSDDEQLLPPHPFWNALLGHELNEEVALPSANAGGRRVKIIKLTDKYGRARVRSFEAWQDRFPGSTAVIKSTFAKNQDGSPDFSPLVRMMEERSARDAAIEEAYESGNFPIASVAEVRGRTCFEAALSMQLRPPSKLWVCHGTDEELERAIEALEQAEEIVLHPTAMATLWALGLVPLLERTRRRIVITPAMLDDLGEFGETVVLEGGFTEPADRLPAVDTLRTWVSTLELRSAVDALYALTPERRDEILERVGQPSLEAIALAADPKRVILVDDLPIADIIAFQHRRPSAWTQALLFWLNRGGHLSEEELEAATVRLIGVGHDFVRISQDTFLATLRRGEWDVRSAEVIQALSLLRDGKREPLACLRLAGLAVTAVFTENLPVETRQNMLWAILGAVEGMEDGGGIAVLLADGLGTHPALDEEMRAEAARAAELWEDARAVDLGWAGFNGQVGRPAGSWWTAGGW